MNIPVLHPDKRTVAFAVKLRQHEAAAAALLEGGKAVEQPEPNATVEQAAAVKEARSKPILTVGEMVEAAYKAKANK